MVMIQRVGEPWTCPCGYVNTDVTRTHCGNGGCQMPVFVGAKVNNLIALLRNKGTYVTIAVTSDGFQELCSEARQEDKQGLTMRVVVYAPGDIVESLWLWRDDLVADAYAAKVNAYNAAYAQHVKMMAHPDIHRGMIEFSKGLLDVSEPLSDEKLNALMPIVQRFCADVTDFVKAQRIIESEAESKAVYDILHYVLEFDGLSMEEKAQFLEPVIA